MLKEITKPKSTSLSDFKLYSVKFLQTEECKSRVLHELFVPLKRHDGKAEN